MFRGQFWTRINHKTLYVRFFPGEGLKWNYSHELSSNSNSKSVCDSGLHTLQVAGSLVGCLDNVQALAPDKVFITPSVSVTFSTFVFSNCTSETSLYPLCVH